LLIKSEVEGLLGKVAYAHHTNGFNKLVDTNFFISNIKRAGNPPTTNLAMQSTLTCYSHKS